MRKRSEINYRYICRNSNLVHFSDKFCVAINVFLFRVLMLSRELGKLLQAYSSFHLLFCRKTRRKMKEKVIKTKNKPAKAYLPKTLDAATKTVTNLIGTSDHAFGALADR